MLIGEVALISVAGLLMLLVVILFFCGLNTNDGSGLTDAQRARLRHYCPQCCELEEGCQCAMC